MVKEINFEKIPIDLHYATEMYAQPFQEFDMYYLEEDNSASSNNKDGGIRDSKVTVSTHEQTKEIAKNNNVKLDFGKRVSMLLKRFTTWLSNMKQRVVEIFSKNFNAQINYVEKNAELNKEIATAIDGHAFNPKVENFPMFNIPLEEISNHSKDIPSRLKPYTDNNWRSMLDPDINAIRALIYPDQVIPYDINKMKDTNYHEQFFSKKKEIDYWAMEQETEQAKQEQESKADEGIKNKLYEYFLFGQVAPGGLNDDSHYTNQLTGKIWLDNCQNILNTKKAIEIGITGMCDNLKKESTNLDQLVEKAQAERDKVYHMDDSDEKTKMLDKQDKYIKRLQSMSTSLIKISNEYAVGFANTMQELFFKKCYNLYKDIVTEYKNVKDTFNQQQPDQQTQQNDQAGAQTQSKTPEVPETPAEESAHIMKMLDEGIFVETYDASKVVVNKSRLQKVIDFFKGLLNKFVNFIKNFLSKFGINFKNTYNREISKIKKNEELNKKIASDLRSGKFKPEVKDFPVYHFDIDKIIKTKMSDIKNVRLANFRDKNGKMITTPEARSKALMMGMIGDIPTLEDLRKQFYHEHIYELVASSISGRSRTKTHLSDDNDGSSHEKKVNLLRQTEYYVQNENFEHNIIQEAVDESKAKPIYVGFELTMPKYISPKEFFSKYDSEIRRKASYESMWNIIREVTGSNITHAFISLEPDLKNTLSYTPKVPDNKSKQGLLIQDVVKHTASPTIALIIFVGFISLESFANVKKFTETQVKNRDITHYNMDEIKNRLFRIRKKKLSENDFDWVCSTFTNAVINAANVNNAISISKSPSPGKLKNHIMHNNDFECVFIGPSDQYNVETVKNNTHTFAKQYYTNMADDKNKSTTDLDAIKPAFKQGRDDVLRNRILFQDDKRKTSDVLTADMWGNLVEALSKNYQKFEKFVDDTITDCKKVSSQLKEEIDYFESLRDNLTEDRFFGNVYDDSTEEYKNLSKTIKTETVMFNFVTETQFVLKKILNDYIEQEYFKVSYQLYQDIISVYKSGPVKESYVETTINNIDDLMTFDIPQYC